VAERSSTRRLEALRAAAIEVSGRVAGTQNAEICTASILIGIRLTSTHSGTASEHHVQAGHTVQSVSGRTLGRLGNCQIGVFLTYASVRGHALIHQELYLSAIEPNPNTGCQVTGNAARKLPGSIGAWPSWLIRSIAGAYATGWQ
jgi:hypothetical protein